MWTRSALLLVVMAVVSGVVSGCGDEAAPVNDRSSPAAAVRSFIHAIDQRNAAAVTAALMTQTPEQQDYAKAMADLMSASLALEAAAQSAFGREDANRLVGASAPGVNEIRRFAEAAARTDGDRATLTTAAGETLNLQKTGSEWKILPGPDASLAAGTAALRKMSQAMTRATDDIRNKKLATAADARRFIAEQGL